MSVDIQEGGLDHPKVQDLLRLHLQAMRSNSPEGLAFALDLSGLKQASITFVAAWEDSNVLGCGAIKDLDGQAGEIKSMRTDSGHLRKGIAARIFDHLLMIARVRGYARVSLETGTGPEFEPALALYRRYGFQKGQAFADYVASDFNQFFYLDLV